MVTSPSQFFFLHPKPIRGEKNPTSTFSWNFLSRRHGEEQLPDRQYCTLLITTLVTTTTGRKNRTTTEGSAAIGREFDQLASHNR